MNLVLATLMWTCVSSSFYNLTFILCVFSFFLICIFKTFETIFTTYTYCLACRQTQCIFCIKCHANNFFIWRALLHRLVLFKKWCMFSKAVITCRLPCALHAMFLNLVQRRFVLICCIKFQYSRVVDIDAINYKWKIEERNQF